MDTEFLKSFLNDIEMSALQAFVDNPVAMRAMKKALLADVYYKGTLVEGREPDPTRNAAFAFDYSGTPVTNEQIGSEIRAMAQGVRLLEGAFSRISLLKSPAKTPAPASPNRGK